MDCDMKDNMLIWVDNWSKQYDPIDIVKWAAKRTQSKRDIRTTREARLEDWLEFVFVVLHSRQLPRLYSFFAMLY